MSVPMKMLWNSLLPLRVTFFVWALWWGKILTSVQLKNMGLWMASMCPLCGHAGENRGAPMYSLSQNWKLWITLFSTSGAGWVGPFLVQDLFHGWIRLPVSKKKTKLWRAVQPILGIFEGEKQHCV